MAGIQYQLLDKTTMLHKAWLSSDGTQFGPPLIVGAEPVFTGALNVGVGQLQLQVDRYPGPGLAFSIPFPASCGFDYFDLVKIWMPDGSEAGIWKYEGYTADLEQKNTWQINLMPLASELSDTDYSANYSAADVAGPPIQAHLGTTLMDIPVAAAVPRTHHCACSSTANDGVSYSVVYPAMNGRVVDTLRQAVTLMGGTWWWYADAHGLVTLASGPRTTVNINTLATPNPIAWEKHNFNNDKCINVLPIIGGNDALGVPIRTTREVTGGAYGTTAIGRRVGQTVVDPGLSDLATVQRYADQILARAQWPIDARTLRLLPSVPILTPGDKVTITDGLGVNGPWWVTDTKLFGSTGVQEITIATQ